MGGGPGRSYSDNTQQSAVAEAWGPGRQRWEVGPPQGRVWGLRWRLTEGEELTLAGVGHREGTGRSMRVSELKTEVNRVLFVGTGCLLSTPTSFREAPGLQKADLPLSGQTSEPAEST